MGRGKDTSDCIGKTQVGCAVSTIFLAFLAMIVGLASMQAIYVPDILQKCGNSGFAVDCSKKPVTQVARRLLSAASTDSSYWTPFTNVVDLVTNFETISKQIVHETKQKLDAPQQKQTDKMNMLAAFTKAAQSKKARRLASPCKVGACCCSTYAKDLGTVAYGPVSNNYPSNGKKCWSDLCDNVAACAGTYCSAKDYVKPTCDDYYQCYRAEQPMKTTTVVGLVCASGKCTDAECCVAKDNSAGTCTKCCGRNQGQMCDGKGYLSSVDYQAILSTARSLIYAAAVMIIIGQIPPLFAAYAKLKDNQSMESCFGCLACPSVVIVGFVPPAAICAYLLYIVYLMPLFNMQMWCAVYESLLKEYIGVGPRCNDDCLAVLHHEKDIVCSLTSGVGATALLTTLAMLLGMGTMVLVCVGCCNRKTHQQPTVQGVIVQNVQQPVQQGVVLQAVPQPMQQGVVQATPVMGQLQMTDMSQMK